MDRNDLERARTHVPNLSEVWNTRVATLEEARRNARDSWHGKGNGADRERMATIYHTIDRCDRSIAFLDRALLHLDDMDHGTYVVESRHPVPLQGTKVTPT